MNLLKQLFSYKPKRADPEVSKGGSTLIRHEESSGRNKIQAPTNPNAYENAEAREKYYEKYFGKIDGVFHEILPLDPHIDVYSFAPQKERSYRVSISSGMSDKPMKLPAKVPTEWSRTEMILLSAESSYKKDPKYIANLVRVYAGFPHQYDTFFFHGHTVPSYNKGESLFPNIDARFTNALISAAVPPDSSIPDEFFTDLKTKDGKVKFFYIIPLTHKELGYKLEKGLESLLDRFDEKGIMPFIFDLDREEVI